MSVLSFFQWCNDAAVSQAIRDSIWLFPFVEALHLLALSVLGGTMLVVDLRLVGLGVRGRLDRLARDIYPWMLGALAVMLATGALLFASEAMKCYENAAFWAKMAFLLPALLFTLTIRDRVTRGGDGRIPAGWNAAVAVTSIALWSGVGLAGRAIGFY